MRPRRLTSVLSTAVLAAATAFLAACGGDGDDEHLRGPAEPGSPGQSTPPGVGSTQQAILYGATVQQGTLTSTASGTQTVTISSIDPSKSFLLFSTRHNSSDPDSSLIRGRIASATTLEFARVSNDSAAINVQWYVVSYPSGVLVQRGQATQTATTVNVTLPAAVGSLSRAFVTYSKTPAAADKNVNDTIPVLAELTTTSNLQFRVNAAASAHTIWWEVVEFLSSSDIDVQRGLTSITGSATTATVTIPTAVDVNKTFVLASFRTAGTGNDMGRRMIRAQLTNSTTITIDRGVGGTGDDLTEIAWQAVQLLDGSTVQQANQNFASGAASANATITSVDLGRTAAFSGAQGGSGQAMGKSAYTSGDILGVASFTFALAATQVTMQRDNTAAAADVGWTVVTFGAPTPVCGNGIVEGTEQCDGSVCCQTGCTFVAAGGSHAGCSDLTPTDCQIAQCDGAGVCSQTQAQVADDTPCGDGVCNQCASGICDDSAGGAPGPGCTAAATECSGADACNGSGGCNANHISSGTACTDSSPTNCQVAQCDGSGACDQAAANVADGAACGDGVCDQCGAGACVATGTGEPGPGCAASATECSASDTCDGSGACNVNDLAAGAACADLSPADCLVAGCNGAGACSQTYATAADGAGCGDGVCDQCNSGACAVTGTGAPGPGCNGGTTECSGADACDGAGGCQTNHVASGAGCTDTTPTDCGLARCDGAGACDQDAADVADGTACGDGVCDQCGAGACVATGSGLTGPGCTAEATECSGADTCNGAGACQANHTGAGTGCGDTTPTDCKDARCDGSGACDQLAANEVDGTSCPAGVCITGDCDPILANGETCFTGAQCASTFCTEGYCCDAACGASCDTCANPLQLGTCSPVFDGLPGTPGCDPYVCDGAGSSCPENCLWDFDCVATAYCEIPGSLTCRPKLAGGASCTAAGQCLSGNCVDGVCCNGPCDGGCNACDLPGTTGTCSAVSAGSAGDPSCSPYVCNGGSGACPTSCVTDTNCASTHYCSASACVPKLIAGASCTTAGQCASGFCVDGVCCNNACGAACEACDVAGYTGTCSPMPDGTQGTPTCSPFLCDGALATCPTSCVTSADCVLTSMCDMGVCEPVASLANGAPCALPTDCVSGFCVDGVCCDTACDGQCDTCDQAGLEGACTNLADGAGGEPLCSPNLCGGGPECRHSCATNAECAPGFLCTRGVCGLSFALTRIWGEGQLLDPDNPAAKSLIYVETAGEATFHVLAPFPEVDVVFYDPADNEITYDSAPGGMYYSRWNYGDEAAGDAPVFDTPRSGPGYHVQLRVVAPAPGLWAVKTTTFVPLTSPMPIQITLETTGGPALGLVTDRAEYTVSQPIKIFAHLRNTAAAPPAAILGGTVTATLLQYNPGNEQTTTNIPPDAVRVSLPLRDDATGGDANANDGVYTGTVTLTTASDYMLNVAATGTDALGHTFRRAAGKDVKVTP